MKHLLLILFIFTMFTCCAQSAEDDTFDHDRLFLISKLMSCQSLAVRSLDPDNDEAYKCYMFVGYKDYYQAKGAWVNMLSENENISEEVQKDIKLLLASYESWFVTKAYVAAEGFGETEAEEKARMIVLFFFTEKSLGRVLANLYCIH